MDKNDFITVCSKYVLVSNNNVGKIRIANLIWRIQKLDDQIIQIPPSHFLPPELLVLRAYVEAAALTWDYEFSARITYSSGLIN